MRLATGESMQRAGDRRGPYLAHFDAMSPAGSTGRAIARAVYASFG
jgi:hypothetical protein